MAIIMTSPTTTPKNNTHNTIKSRKEKKRGER